MRRCEIYWNGRRQKLKRKLARYRCVQRGCFIRMKMLTVPKKLGKPTVVEILSAQRLLEYFLYSGCHVRNKGFFKLAIRHLSIWRNGLVSNVGGISAWESICESYFLVGAAIPLIRNPACACINRSSGYTGKTVGRVTVHKATQDNSDTPV